MEKLNTILQGEQIINRDKMNRIKILAVAFMVISMVASNNG